MRAKRRIGRMALSCGLPEDVITRGARITMMGRGCVLVEGHRGVMELGDARIRLRTGEDVLCVSGDRLALRELSLDAAIISGARIDAASYAKTV